MIRLLLHSPARSMTLEVMDHNRETNEVTVMCYQTGAVYKMPYDPAAWKEKGWVREKIDDDGHEDMIDNRLRAV